MVKSMLIKIEEGKVKVQSEYNKEFIRKAHELQGKWESPYWTFPEENEELVRNALFDVYGEDGRIHKNVTIDIDLDNFSYDREIKLGNIVIVKRDWRDSPVTINKNVVVIKGGFCGRGGSRSTPRVTHEEGTVIRVRDLPEEIYEKIKDLEGITLIDANKECDEKAKRAALEREREEIIRRLEEINKQLGIA